MIKVDNLKKTYDRRTRHANTVLHNISFTLPDRGFVCILGASGCGKTSLLNAIGGLDSYDSGLITTDTAEINRSGSRAMEDERNASFGYIFQNYYLLSEHSAAYNVYIGMHSMQISKKEKMERVRDALQRVDMLRYRKRPVGNLSGGQQQRVAIARAIARRPKVIFADEPTGNLDEANTLNICTILKELSRESLVVMVTHEDRVAKFFADRIITLDDGNIVSDTSSWAKGTMDAGEKDAIYTEEYETSSSELEGISLRILRKDGAEHVELSVVIENDRIVIKSCDPRVILSSEANTAPRIIEGARPVLSSESFEKAEAYTPKESNKDTALTEKKQKTGLGFGFLLREARSLVSGKKLRKFSTGLFIILLSLMIALTASDIITVSHIDPEDFINSDSHVLEFSFDRGPELPYNVWVLDEYIKDYMDYLNASGLDFDYIPKGGASLKYTDETVPQLGKESLSLSGFSYAKTERLDKSSIIAGRAPESYEEIVIDRWVIDKILEEDGIIQNVIPNAEYFIGKALNIDKKALKLKVVGICDSGEPTVYVTEEALLSLGVGGTELITLSDFRARTGYDKITSLEPHECIVLSDLAGEYYLNNIGGIFSSASDYVFTIKDAVKGTGGTVSAKFVVSDDAIPEMYRTMISSSTGFNLWCSDKAALYAYLDAGMPEEIKGTLDVGIKDRYELAYSKYEQKTQEKIDARTIVTATVLSLSLVMLYLMQRSKIKERMDLVAVYRLLGIPKRNLMTVFALESMMLTLKYSIPTVLAVWLGINALSFIDVLGTVMIYPFWAAILTLASILVVRLLIAALPVIRLLSKPPARLAAMHDF